MRTLGLIAVAAFSIAPMAAIAVAPGAQQNNPKANANACWGQDRSYYASDKTTTGWTNNDLKQSFPNDINDEKAAWVATYCEPHGNQN